MSKKADITRHSLSISNISFFNRLSHHQLSNTTNKQQKKLDISKKSNQSENGNIQPTSIKCENIT